MMVDRYDGCRYNTNLFLAYFNWWMPPDIIKCTAVKRTTSLTYVIRQNKDYEKTFLILLFVCIFHFFLLRLVCHKSRFIWMLLKRNNFWAKRKTTNIMFNLLLITTLKSKKHITEFKYSILLIYKYDFSKFPSNLH